MHHHSAALAERFWNGTCTASAAPGLLQGLNLLLQLCPAQLGLLAPSDGLLVLACIPPPHHHTDCRLTVVPLYRKSSPGRRGPGPQWVLTFGSQPTRGRRPTIVRKGSTVVCLLWRGRCSGGSGRAGLGSGSWGAGDGGAQEVAVPAVQPLQRQRLGLAVRVLCRGPCLLIRLQLHHAALHQQHSCGVHAS